MRPGGIQDIVGTLMKAQEKSDIYDFLTLAQGWVEGRKIEANPPVFRDSPDPVPFCPTHRDFAEALESCRRCEDQSGKPHPGCGTFEPGAAEVLVVSERPLNTDESSPEYALLLKMLSAIALDPGTNCGITALIKCADSQESNTGRFGADGCAPWFESELRLVSPLAVLSLGEGAARLLAGSSEPGEMMFGRKTLWKGTPVIGTYHPADLLADPQLKRPAWEHLKTLKTILDSAGRRDF